MNSDICFNENDLSLDSINNTNTQNIIILIDGMQGAGNKGYCITSEEFENLTRKTINLQQVVKHPYSGQWLDSSIIEPIERGWNTILITGMRTTRVGSAEYGKDYNIYSGHPILRSAFLHGTIDDMRNSKAYGNPEDDDRSDYGAQRENPEEYTLTENEINQRNALISANRIANNSIFARQEQKMRAPTPLEEYLNSLSSNITALDISRKCRGRFPDISRFTELETLLCRQNDLEYLSNLPDTLINLDCADNKLIELPELPNGLKELWCNNNKLTTLPSLPNSLQYIDCRDNKLTELPQNLPPNLIQLTCSNNELTELPRLPNRLERLYCSYNKLSGSLDIPQSVKYIDCSNNKLRYPPPRDSRLSYYVCDHQRP